MTNELTNELTNQLTKVKPGDHVTIAGTVDYIDKFGTMSITTKSGYVINAKLEDIQTHRPMKEDQKGE